MNPRNSVLLAVAILVALAVYMYAFERKEPESEGEEAVVLVSVDPSDLTGIKIARSDGTTIRLERVEPPADVDEESVSEGGSDSENAADDTTGASEEPATSAASSWRLVEPVAWDASQTIMERILRIVESLEAQSVLEEEAASNEAEGATGAESVGASGSLEDLAGYGLGEGQTVVTLETTDGEKSFAIGDPTPVGGAYYAKLAEDSQVYTISAIDAGAFLTEADNFRDREIFTVALDDVRSATLSTEEGTSQLELVDGVWRLRDPWNDLADVEEVRSVLQPFTMLQAVEFVDEPEDLAEYGLESPRAVLKIAAGDPPDAVNETIYVGNDGEQEGTVWVKTGAGPTVYLVQVGELKAPETGPFDLFLKDLVPTEGLLAVDQIELIGADDYYFSVRKVDELDEEGKPTGEFDWRVGDQVVDPQKMTDFLGALIDVDVVEIGDPITEEERSELEHFTIRVHKSPENAEETTDIVRFGEPEGERVRATASNRPRVYEASTEALQKLRELADGLLEDGQDDQDEQGGQDEQSETDEEQNESV